MPRKLSVFVAAGLVLTLTVVNAGAIAADDDAKQIANKVTAAGAALFDARDAKGLAMTYTEDARLEIIAKDKDSGELKTETKVGRAEIQAYYHELFGKSNEPIHARNIVEYARLLDADLLTISGVFEPDTQRAEPLKLPFLQVRARRGGEWRIVSLQVYVVPQK